MRDGVLVHLHHLCGTAADCVGVLEPERPCGVRHEIPVRFEPRSEDERGGVRSSGLTVTPMSGLNGETLALVPPYSLAWDNGSASHSGLMPCPHADRKSVV